jgi:hypothetical protein
VFTGTRSRIFFAFAAQSIEMMVTRHAAAWPSLRRHFTSARQSGCGRSQGFPDISGFFSADQ